MVAKPRFPSHLFSAAEVRSLAAPAVLSINLIGQICSTDASQTTPQWNPAQAAPNGRFLQACSRLENRFSHDPAFIDYLLRTSLMVRTHQKS